MATAHPADKSQANKKDASIPVRFHLPNGEKVGLNVTKEEKFSHIKEKIWQKKKFSNNKDNFVFKVMNGEVYFDDDEQFARILELNNIFNESGHVHIMEAQLIPAVDMGDKHRRQNKRPSEEGPYIIQGHLYKRGSNKTTPFRKRYFILDSFTLYYFESEKAFFSKEKCTDYIPMGSCDVVKTDELFKNKQLCFELKAEHIGLRNYSLAAESEEELEKWVKAFQLVKMRRLKAIIITTAEELNRRGFESEGIFRLSGTQKTLEQLKSEYDTGDFPDLKECKDENAIAGVLKTALREMPEPLLTFTRYNQLVKVGQIIQPEKRLQPLIDVLTTLPQENKAMLVYLLRFVCQVCKFAEKNLMTSKNLAIVFGPNIIRPQVDTVETMNDAQYITPVVQTMIEQFDEWSVVMDPSEEEGEGDSDSEQDDTKANKDRFEQPTRAQKGSVYEQLEKQPPSPRTAAAKVIQEAQAKAPQDARSVPVASPLGAHHHHTHGESLGDNANFMKELQLRQRKKTDAPSGAALSPRDLSPLQPTPLQPPSLQPPPLLSHPIVPSAQPAQPPLPPSSAVPTPIVPASPRSAATQPLSPRSAAGRQTQQAETGKRETVEVASVATLQKAFDEALQGWGPKINEKKAALQRSWEVFTATTQQGIEPSKALYTKLGTIVSSAIRYQENVFAFFDQTIATINEMADDIKRTKEEEEKATKEAAERAAERAATEKAAAEKAAAAKAMAAEAATLKAAAEKAAAERIAAEKAAIEAAERAERAATAAAAAAAAMGNSGAHRRVRAVYDYVGGHRADEITFKANDEFDLLDDSDKAGWWKGSINGREGWFPGAYVKLI